MKALTVQQTGVPIETKDLWDRLLVTGENLTLTALILQLIELIGPSTFIVDEANMWNSQVHGAREDGQKRLCAY